MTRYIIDFTWQDGAKDWRTVDANSEAEAIEIFRTGGSFKGSYKNVTIRNIEVRR